MDNMLESLKNYGVDISGAMRRFLDDEDLYKTCLSSVLSDGIFTKLGEAISEKNWTSAFEYAHTLKGTTGNMGLTPIYQIICNIVNDLRKKEYSSLQSQYMQAGKEIMAIQSIQNNAHEHS